MKNKNQLKGWDGNGSVKLWIVKTPHGIKRTWKASESDVRDAAQKLGVKIISIRAGTERDALVKF